MKLFYGPGACSMGIHILLEEIGKPYDAVRLDMRAGDTQKPDFLAINPKGKVPTIQRDDGTIVTEYPVIAHWLAATNPAAGLLPDADRSPSIAELNGIAYDDATSRLFVTGKNWPEIFQIALVPK